MNNSLTPRELEVLKLITEGKTNNQIAKELVVSHHTVKAHIAAIIRKIGGKRRVDLAVKAVLLGLI